jgi:hypothetical protein
MLERPLDEKAEVGAARRRVSRVRLDFRACAMEIQLLGAEMERDSIAIERLPPHTQTLVERDCC